MVWSVTRAIGASAHGLWYGNSVLCLTVSRQLSPRQAVSPNTIIGTCGAVVNIGAQDDRVAECFGLVIDEKWRFQYVGKQLFKRLCDSLIVAENAAFIIAETRTSHSGDSKFVSP